MTATTVHPRHFHEHVDPAERPEIHTNGETHLIYPDGRTVLVSTEELEHARRVVSKSAMEDPHGVASEASVQALVDAEEQCFGSYGLVRAGDGWAFRE